MKRDQKILSMRKQIDQRKIYTFLNAHRLRWTQQNAVNLHWQKEILEKIDFNRGFENSMGK